MAGRLPGRRLMRRTSGRRATRASYNPPVQAFYSDHFVLPLPEGHRFPMAKYRLLRERVAARVAGHSAFGAGRRVSRTTGAGACAGLHRPSARRQAGAARGPCDRLSMVTADGGAVAAFGWRHDRRVSRGKTEWRCRQPRRRYTPRAPRPRSRLLRVQRCCGRRARAAGRWRVPATRAAGGDHRPRCAPGRWHGGDPGRRRLRVHAVDPWRHELPVPQAAQRS